MQMTGSFLVLGLLSTVGCQGDGRQAIADGTAPSTALAALVPQDGGASDGAGEEPIAPPQVDHLRAAWEAYSESLTPDVHVVLGRPESFEFDANVFEQDGISYHMPRYRVRLRILVVLSPGSGDSPSGVVDIEYPIHGHSLVMQEGQSYAVRLTKRDGSWQPLVTRDHSAVGMENNVLVSFGIAVPEFTERLANLRQEGR